MAKIAHAFIVSIALTFPPLALALPASQGDIPADGYTISPGALDDALIAFATRNRLQLIYSPALVARRRTAGLRGEPPVRESLARLLDGTGLTAVAVKANVYLLQPAPRPRPQRVPIAVPAPAAASRGPTTTELDTVHVTGSRIGRAAFESSLPLTLITNEQIRASGHQTLFDVLRLMPGMSGHHPRNVATENGASQVPSAAAASASLYSLGPRATLFLVDGRRMANYGLVSTDYGALTDLNGIPLSMVDHIEIAHGGASAIYGADAMAGVVNIILKKDYRGAEVGASYGVSQRGDAEQQRQYASFGEQTPGGGSVFVSVDRFTRNPLIGSQRAWATMDQRRNGGADGRYKAGYGLGYAYWIFEATKNCEDRDEQTNPRFDIDCRLDLPRYVSLQPGIDSSALYTYFRQPFGENKEFYADLRATRVKLDVQTAPFNAALALPAEHPDGIVGTRLNYWFTDVGPIRSRTVTTTRDFTVGVKGEHDRWDWDLSLAQRRNKVDNRIRGLISLPVVEAEVKTQTLHFNKSETNTPDVLQRISPATTLGGEMVLDTLSGSLEGPLLELPGGEASLAVGFEARREVLTNRPDDAFLKGDVALAQEFDLRRASRNTSAVYAEVNVPLHENLWVDAAWRVDRSSGYGNQVSPMFGLRWQPLKSLILRASASEGYRAPTLAELRRPLSFGQTRDYVAAKDVALPCAVPVWTEPDQTGEEYCWVDVTSKVNTQLRPETSTSRNFGAVWSPSESFTLSLDRYRIHRSHEILPVEPIEYPKLFQQSFVGDEYGYLVGAQRYLSNYGSTRVSGWELSADYRHPTRNWGEFGFRLTGHYMDRLMRRVHPQAPELDYAGFGAPDTTVLGSVRWSYRDWITTLNVHYMGSVEVARDRPGSSCATFLDAPLRCRTPSATLLDLDLAYGGFDKWLIGLNISNLNDRRPVNYDYNSGGYSLVDDDPVGRYYLLSAMYRF
ncbi:TonB-dependent receptor [Lysobacter enzymogenes]|uniref:TonB-dependent receptor n=1 Tax=Lysobacter enzymogenes TaxID=69 RepID=UPI001A95BE86|nr:TonB-dependent receptor [Lysobacter enzymogenes]QQP95550.1 TonB-dependent receptor [Lysobacter enzymogenes]